MLISGLISKLRADCARLAASLEIKIAKLDDRSEWF
jgi:hypothetical protein